jgi:predicted metal-binding membrane protein
MAGAALESILKRDRLVVLASLLGLLVLAWLYLFKLSAGMGAMDMAGGATPMDMPGMEMSGMDMDGMPSMAGQPAPSPIVDFALLALMWSVMMVGMMLPGAAPTTLLFSALERKRSGGPIAGRVSAFVVGYFLVWSLFSIIAAAAQTTLAHVGLISAQMAITSTLIGGAVFVLAGLYEFSPLKNRCLAHCRSPMEWIPLHMRPGRAGALRMGIEHGAYCLGCCWMLMLLLFVGGVMNLLWVAVLSAAVLAQKILPGGIVTARFVGVALVGWGIVLLARPLVMT